MLFLLYKPDKRTVFASLLFLIAAWLENAFFPQHGVFIGS